MHTYLQTNRIHHGDCLQLMKGIPAKSVDMILCDLPYGTTQNKWDSVIPLDLLWAEYERIIKTNLGDAIQPGAKPDIGDLSFVNS